ncbi:hypothetical protein N7468_000325 [Penicillium chermesinum]|uniref:RBR-type E3 ubiquitin transferase n=1 Tax=Penicillium chermesinum TaxID=63820 RepID=A0A9W9PN22_9EURO|nr:uncharacterized protein N7468_000325 [Penicillium chermesinum]KAJ5248874.1 hypothetical protein N7468_000325 [Penicillium chermesinum]
MTEADETSEDDRSVELSSIAAIFPEIKINPESPFKATLDLPVALPSPTKVYFQQPVDVGFPAALTPPTSIDEHKAELDQTAARDVHVLSYLPPVNLHIELPDGYPSEKPPRVQLNTQPPWLPAPILAKLSNDCERLWKECGQDMVVFTYIDHLQQLAETAFGIQDTNDGELYLARDLKIPLLDFNSKTEREKFEQGTFECGICLEPKKGASCHRLLRCSHVFCVPCLQDFYNTCITEGDVDSVKCLAPDCDKNQHPTPAPGSEVQTPRRKKDRTIGPSELLQIPLSTETVQRYVFLKRKKKIEADTNTVYCPRHWCQGAARSKRHPKPQDPMEDDDGSDDDEASPTEPNGKVDEAPSRENRLAICEDCNYAFCAICKKGWHGDLVFCVPRLQAEPTEEEKATEEYFRLYTTHCPTCNVPCQKLMGCNHMRCVKCDTHFCYLCSAWLSPDNPYRHFNEEGRYCYNRLWDLEGGDGENPIGADALHNIFEVDSDDDAPNELFWDLHSSDEEPEPEAEPPRRRHRAPPPAPIPLAPMPPHETRKNGSCVPSK